MTKKRVFFYGWIVLAACFVIAAMAYGPNYAFSIFVKPLTEAFQTTRAATALTFSLYLVIYGATGILLGRLTDKYGPRTIIAIGGVTMGIGYLLTSRVDAVWQLYLTWSLIVGAGAGIGFVPPSAVVSRWFTRRRGLALGILASGQAVGGIITAPLVERFLSSYGLSNTFLILSVMNFVIIIGAAMFLKRAPSEQVKIEPAKIETVDTLPGITLSRAIRTRQFWIVWPTITLFGFGLSIVQAHLFAFTTDVGIEAGAAATGLSLWYWWSILGRVAMGGISDKIGRKPAMVFCLGLQSLTMIMLMGVRNVPMLYTYALISGFSYGGVLPLIPALTGDVFGTRSLGAIFGGIFFGACIGGGFGSTMAGRIYDAAGNYNAAFIIGAIAYAAAMALVFLVRPVKTAAPAMSASR